MKPQPVSSSVPVSLSEADACEECTAPVRPVVTGSVPPAPTTDAADMHSLLQRPLPLPSPSSPLPLSEALQGGMDGVRMDGVRIGRVAQVSAEGVQVLLSGGDAPVSALSLCALTPEDAGRSCAVLFVDGDVRRPLVVGCVVDEPPLAQPAAAQSELAPSELAPQVVVDGELVRIEARQELELRCGEAVILLQRDGRIEIRGNYVTSQARATQRLRGGSVHIN